MSSGRLLLVRVAAERIALPIEHVRELLDAPVLTPVALAPRAVVGQLALRGTYLPVLALADLLGVPRAAAASAAAAGDAAPGVALVMGDGEYAALVDDVLDFWEAEQVQLRAMPAGGDARGQLRGVVQRGSEVAGLVDMSALQQAAVATLRTTPHA